jgi:hypothetical protein
MSFEYVVDITLHLGNFRNFELLLTGAYRIRVQTYTLDDAKKNKGCLDMQDSSFCSSSFYVDFSDVYKELNQICVFRYVFESDVPQEIFFDFELQMLSHCQVPVAHPGPGWL